VQICWKAICLRLPLRRCRIPSLDLLRIQQMSAVLSRGLESSAIFAPAY